MSNSPAWIDVDKCYMNYIVDMDASIDKPAAMDAPVSTALERPYVQG